MMQEVEAKQLRSFGLLIGGIFAVISLWPTLFRRANPRLWTLVLAGLLVLLAFVLPRSLKLVYRVWMALGHVLGQINTRILLGLVFYGIFTPIGLFMRLSGKDPMHRKFEREADTYHTLRQPRSGSHMKHQF